MANDTIPALVNRHARGAAPILAALEEVGGFQVETLEDSFRLERRATELWQSGVRRIAVAGGDGTLRVAVRAMRAAADGESEIAVLPAGTRNHFARDHDIPLEPAAAARLARDGRATPTDLGEVNGEVFLNTSSIGDYSRFVAVRESIEGRVGYRLATLLAVLRVYATLRWLDVGLEVDGEARVYRTPCLLVAVGERDLKGQGGLRVPEGRRSLHVLVPRAQTRRAVARLLLSSLLAGLEATAAGPGLDSFHVDACRVTMRLGRRSARHVALDGDVLALRAPFEYHFRASALSVVRP